MVRMGGWLDGVYWMEAWHDGACNVAAVIIVPMGAWLMEPQDLSRRRMVQMTYDGGSIVHRIRMIWFGWEHGTMEPVVPPLHRHVKTCKKETESYN